MRRRLPSLLTIALALSTLSSCLEATSIVLEISTSVDCSVVQANGVAIAVGMPGDDSTSSSAETVQCSSGSVGTIVLVPSGADNQVGVRVMLGLSGSTNNCKSPNFDGCIVARRIVSYVAHTTITVPVELDPSCANQPCSPVETCVSGSCVPAGVMCTNGVCQ